MRMGFVAAAVVVAFLIAASFVAAAEQKVFVLTLKYDSGAITSEGVILTTGFFQEPLTKEGDYRLEAEAFDGTVLYTEYFSFDLQFGNSPPNPEWFDEEGRQIYIPTAEEAGRVAVTEALKEFIIPYFPTAKSIKVYDSRNSLLLEVSVAHFADRCGNGLCNAEESYDSCPSDCLSGSVDDYCDGVSDGMCDPDCGVNLAVKDADCASEEEQAAAAVAKDGKVEAKGASGSRKNWLHIGLAVFAALVAALWLFGKYTKLKMKQDGYAP